MTRVTELLRAELARNGLPRQKLDNLVEEARRDGKSWRQIAELIAEHGVTISHNSLHRWYGDKVAS